LANTNNSIIRNCKEVTIGAAHSQDFGQQALDIQIFSAFYNHIENNYANIWLTLSSNNDITQNTGVIRLDKSDSNKINDNYITSISFVSVDHSGAVLGNSSNNELVNNRITGNSAGISFGEDASNNLVMENTIWDNAQGGVVIGQGAISNTIFHNDITDNGNYGIIDAGFNNSIVGNSLRKNRGNGLELSGSENCSVMGNIIEGFLFGGFNRDTTNCIVVGNDIMINSIYSQHDIWFLGDYPGTFYHNNFFAPINFDHAEKITHIWDNGIQGNYWSVYNGIDTNGDGIGDSPYQINDINVDRYPLIHPFDISAITPKSPT
jgi:parallel beta-helix repeat protein